MRQNIEDFELMPIELLAIEAKEAADRPGGLLPLIQMGAEAQARLPRIPDVEGIFDEQRTQLKGIITIANQAVEQSKLSEEAMRPKATGMGY